MTHPASTILLVLEDFDGTLRVLVHPGWRQIVKAQDLDYIESLLKDFPERAALHPGDLFAQLSSLAVGPLITHETGERISDYPALAQLCSGFVQI